MGGRMQRRFDAVKPTADYVAHNPCVLQIPASFRSRRERAVTPVAGAHGSCRYEAMGCGHYDGGPDERPGARSCDVRLDFCDRLTRLVADIYGDAVIGWPETREKFGGYGSDGDEDRR